MIMGTKKAQMSPKGGVMKKLLGLLLVCSLALALASCATAPAKWKDDTVSGLHKGQSGESVIKQFGQPDSKSTDANGTKCWEYRKPTASKSGTNTFAAITTFGIMNGGDSFYVDILRVYLKNNKVVNFTYDENINSLTQGGKKTTN
jgi:hypothetical protein